MKWTVYRKQGLKTGWDGLLENEIITKEEITYLGTQHVGSNRVLRVDWFN